MSTIIVEVDEAFPSAGAGDDEAKAAAKAPAERKGRFAEIEAELLVMK